MGVKIHLCWRKKKNTKFQYEIKHIAKNKLWSNKKKHNKKLDFDEDSNICMLIAQNNFCISKVTSLISLTLCMDG